MQRKIKTVKLDAERELIFETGKIAKQASGAVIATLGETMVFSTACAAPTADQNVDFLPLRVDYQEKFSSAGKTLGGFIKREGRPSEKEILVSRLIDRPLRPLFADGYYNEVQVLAYVWSYDGLNQPDPLAICAASAALTISDIPFSKPVAGVRVGLIQGQYRINPTTEEMQASTLDLVLAGTEEAILMIEGYCDFLTEEQIVEAISVGHEAIRRIAHALAEWREEVGKPKNTSTLRAIPASLIDLIDQKAALPLRTAIHLRKKQERDAKIEEIQTEVVAALFPEGSEAAPFSLLDIKGAFKQVLAKYMRQTILDEGIRVDGRGLRDIRAIDVETGLLPRAHGSCLFTRGETQSLAVCTLGGECMGQRYESLDGEGLRRFYLQYFFPPFSVGEVGRMGPAGRRELGHGKLAERALGAILPPQESFPYTIRLESNITESNGSSSMASVCSCCLALMDAGVPIKQPVTGIAMGLILEEKRVAILSDILGMEDFLGDMDFKVTGNAECITAFQMDIKVEGITLEIMKQALAQAREGRAYILDKMLQVLPKARQELSLYAPRIETMMVKPSKIAVVIGPGGKQIRSIIEQTGVQIDINDTGLVSISSSNPESMAAAKRIIEGLVAEAEVGKLYEGKITSIMPFGAFVEILPGKEGLCHVSELAETRVENVRDVVQEGEIITVKLLEINDRGQLRLSRKAVLLQGSDSADAAEGSRSPPARSGGRGNSNSPRHHEERRRR